MRRFVATVVLGAALLVGSGCSNDRSNNAAESRPAPADLRANQAILDELVPYPGSELVHRQDIGAPRGGRGASSYFYFVVDQPDRASIVAHFQRQLDGWRVVKEESFATRTTSVFVNRTKWLNVTASDVAASAEDVTPTPGYVIAINAADAGVLAQP